MLLWNLYFLTKIALHFQNKLQLNAGLNFVLFAGLLLNHLILQKHPIIRGLLYALIFPIPALLITLQECGFTPTIQLLLKALNLSEFSNNYLLELLHRTFPMHLWISLLLASLLLHLTNRYLRTNAWIGSALLILSLSQLWNTIFVTPSETLTVNPPLFTQKIAQPSAAAQLVLGTEALQKLENQRSKPSAQNTPQQQLDTFFSTQSKLPPVQFSSENGTPNFDLLVLHICSLAWTDLEFAHQTQHPLLQNADFLFSKFNGAVSYSGPSALHLLRSTCGQTDNQNLYNPANSQCQLFGQLHRAGFTIETGLNHNGTFDQFKEALLKNIGAPSTHPIAYDKVPRGTIAFDGTPIARDGDYLRAWWQHRLTQPNTKPIALYYNTITLHDGNKLPNSPLDSLKTYPTRLTNLLDDLNNLIDLLTQSQRKIMLIILPEHGAGLSGAYGQLPGLREIPTPAITEIPVLGYWIAPGHKRPTHQTAPITNNQPTSYYSLTTLLSRWMKLPPSQQNNPPWNTLMTNLPTTPFVAQQTHLTVMEYQNQYLLKTPDNEWKPLIEKKPQP